MGAKKPRTSSKRRKSRKIFTAGLSSHQKLLISGARRWRLRRHKGQLEVVDDAIDHGKIGDEGDDLDKILEILKTL